MAKPRLYIDTCCLVEVLKGRAGKSVEHPKEADMTKRVMRAARDGKIDLFTSTITIAEILHLGDKPPPSSERLLIERLLLSGRDGIVTIETTPFIVTKARDLAWTDGLYGRAADRIHVASAIDIGAGELLTLDGYLEKKFKKTQIQGCKLIPASQTELLPSEYLADDLFGQT